jgi:hypothetical protein
MALSQLKRIHPDDKERRAALEKVKAWIDGQLEATP